MDSPITLRLDRKTRERIAKIVGQRQVTVSHAIREAIEAWVEAHEANSRPYDRAEDLVGVVRGGKPGRSEQSGRQMKDLLKARRSRR